MRSLLSALSDVAPTLCSVVGLVFLVVAAALFSTVAGVAAAGVALLFVGWWVEHERTPPADSGTP